ncbi:FadR/GntR family transcriptional regulator [Cytobacillus sp. FSL K6-0129]|uniref:FadR/GntR family transcriptional regulator n=1 Tax=Cytobacillus sp. FSL K6-0129 TaxID=2921421 RepID=UPI0030FA625E
MSQKKKIHMIITEQLEGYIINQQLSSGDRLPPERVLATLFSSSRTSIREALKILEMKGVLEIRQGSGTYIRSVDCLTSEAPILSANPKTNIYEMLDLRKVLEVECAGLASSRATSTDIANIRHSLLAMETASTPEDGIHADFQFHLHIVYASHHSIFIKLMNNLTEHMKNTIKVTRSNRFAEDNKREKSTMEEHRDIYLAIASGNGNEARQLMSNHINRVRKELSESMLFNEQAESYL